MSKMLTGRPQLIQHYSHCLSLLISPHLLEKAVGRNPEGLMIASLSTYPGQLVSNVVMCLTFLFHHFSILVFLRPSAAVVDRPTQVICISDIYLSSWWW